MELVHSDWCLHLFICPLPSYFLQRLLLYLNRIISCLRILAFRTGLARSFDFFLPFSWSSWFGNRLVRLNLFLPIFLCFSFQSFVGERRFLICLLLHLLSCSLLNRKHILICFHHKIMNFLVLALWRLYFSCAWTIPDLPWKAIFLRRIVSVHLRIGWSICARRV